MMVMVKFLSVFEMIFLFDSSRVRYRSSVFACVIVGMVL